MDTDLDTMTREQLIDEVKSYAPAFVPTGTRLAMICAGITRTCGPCFPKGPGTFPQCPTGPSSCVVACSTAHRWMFNVPRLPAFNRNLSNESLGASMTGSQGCHPFTSRLSFGASSRSFSP